MASVHEKLERVRKPRVHIKYEVETEGAMVVKELPFVVGVLGDFSGNPTQPLKPFGERKFVQIDRDNFDEVMRRMTPGLNIAVANTLQKDGTDMQVNLKFESMDDFEPGAVVQQVPALKALLDARNELRAGLAAIGMNEAATQAALDQLVSLHMDVLSNNMPMPTTPRMNVAGLRERFAAIDAGQPALVAASHADALPAQAQFSAEFALHGILATVQPDPANFNLPGPELQVIPDRRSLGDVGMTPSDLGLAVQAFGDGAIIGEYRVGGETIDLKVIAKDSVDQKFITDLADKPLATPVGAVVPLSSVAAIHRVTSPPQINRVNRQRAVTLQFTAPPGTPLEAAINDIDQMITQFRQTGAIPPDIRTDYTGSASKLKSVIGGRSREQEMIIEGLIAIAQGENPRNIEAKLAGFLH